MAQPFPLFVNYVIFRDADCSFIFLHQKMIAMKNFLLPNAVLPGIWVAFGMIGASLSRCDIYQYSGVVGAGKVNQCFSYMQMVWGYLIGYAIIAKCINANLLSLSGEFHLWISQQQILGKRLQNRCCIFHTISNCRFCISYVYRCACDASIYFLPFFCAILDNCIDQYFFDLGFILSEEE